MGSSISHSQLAEWANCFKTVSVEFPKCLTTCLPQPDVVVLKNLSVESFLAAVNVTVDKKAEAVKNFGPLFGPKRKKKDNKDSQIFTVNRLDNML